MINSAMPNLQAKHKFPYKPAASAQRADAVLPYPAGVRRLSTRLGGLWGFLRGCKGGDSEPLPRPLKGSFPLSQKAYSCTRSNAVSSVQNPANFLNSFSWQVKHHPPPVQNPATILNRFSWQAQHRQPPCIDRAGAAPPTSLHRIGRPQHEFFIKITRGLHSYYCVNLLFHGTFSIKSSTLQHNARASRIRDSACALLIFFWRCSYCCMVLMGTPLISDNSR